MVPLTEFLRLFEVRPEEAERAVAELAGGAGATATLDGVLEGVYRSNPEFWAEKFPFLAMPIFPDRLPRLDDCIVAGTGLVLAALGALTENRDLFRVGLGGSLYGGAMWLKEAIARLSLSFEQKTSEPRFAVKPRGRYQVTG
jgi:hypothetical protein